MDKLINQDELDVINQIRTDIVTAVITKGEKPALPRHHLFSLSMVGLLVVFLFALALPQPTRAASLTTAWQHGRFAVDVPDVVRQSNIVLGKPNTSGSQSMPLGNGVLGSAVWSANGLTAELSRVDTFPERKSPGQVVIPGLAKLSTSSDYKGSVDLYDAMFNESGGGMSASAYILHNKDELIVDVKGADPNSTQTAQVQLWAGRS